MVGSCEYVNEHSGYVNSRDFFSRSAVVFTGIINQNRKEFSYKMNGQYIPTTSAPSLDMLHQTTGD